ncbi:NADH dehydrogenase subunit 6 (mitochondrion) [Diutina catenulata]
MNLISGISSLLAISILSPVQSILCLIVLFVSTAICLYSQGYVLMGILYVLIYVGAIAILFLFILSLLKIDYTPEGNISPLIITILIICLIPLDLTYDTFGIVMEKETVWNELVIVGTQLYTEYAILLIITGIILILSVIGAIAVTK